MKKYEIAYHNYAEAKRSHQVQKYFIRTQQVTLCVRSKQQYTTGSKASITIVSV